MNNGDGGLSIFKTRGIILKTQDYGESDKLVWIFTEKLGKITAIAKGAKKNKSKFLSLTLPFCFGDYLVFRGRNMYTLSEGEIIYSFQELLRDFDTITYASYLCELIDISLQDEESNRELFKDFVSTFYLINSTAVDNKLLLRAFEVKLLQHTGYGINLESCSICRQSISTSDYVDLQHLGGVCKKCERTGGIRIKPAAYNTLKFLARAELDKISRVSITNEINDELYKVLSEAISSNYARRPKSLDILNY